MEKNKRLALNTMIYFIGNFGAKLLGFIIVPIYSGYIKPDALGGYDLIITTLSLIQPIILFQLNDGIFRWLLAETDEARRSTQIRTAGGVVLGNMLIATVALCALRAFWKVPYFGYVLVLLNLNAVYPFIQQVTRGLGRNKLYSFVGLFVSVIMFAVALILIVFFGFGVEGLFIAQIVSQACGVIVMLFSQKIFRRIFSVASEKDLRRALVKYSLPLVPNYICWWVVSMSDRYVIRGFLGSFHNGIFSMASRFSSAMSVVTSIFLAAWQESAILEYDKEDRDRFYSDIFHKYAKFLFSAVFVLIPFTRLIIEKFVDPAYADSWHYTSILYMAAIFNALAAFLGVGYLSSKNTMGDLVTSSIAAILNIVADLVLIRFIGLYAAAISTFVAYFALFVIRIFHTRKYFKIKLHSVLFGLMLAGGIGVCLCNEFLSLNVNLVIMGVGMIVAVLLNLDLIRLVLGKVFHKKAAVQTSEETQEPPSDYIDLAKDSVDERKKICYNKEKKDKRE